MEINIYPLVYNHKEALIMKRFITKKKLITSFVAILITINLIASAFLFFDIQLMEAPETTIKIDILEINAEEAILQTTIDVSNPNGFGLITENFEIAISTPDGKEVSHISLDGGSIPPQSSKTFTTDAVIAFDEVDPEILTTQVTGVVGVSIGFIQKTIPISINVLTSLEGALESFASPSLNIRAKFGGLTADGVNLSGTIEVYNPNKFDIYIDNISVTIETEKGENVGNMEIIGGLLSSKGTLELESEGVLFLEALNAKTLSINMSGKAGAKIAGVNQSISFSTEVEIAVPDVSKLLDSEIPTDISIIGDYKVTFKGIMNYITLEANNPNKIDVELRDIVVTVNRIDDGEKMLIAETGLQEGVIKAESVKQFKGQMLLPYSKLFIIQKGRLLPDELEITVRAHVTLPGLNQSIWVGVSGYQDFRLFQ